MILWCIGGDDATEEAQDDWIERSVPGAAGPDHQQKHELVLLAGKIDWDWIDGEIAPLYSENGRRGIETRFMIGLLLLKHIMGFPMKGWAIAGSTTRNSSSSPVKSFSSTPSHTSART